MLQLLKKYLTGNQELNIELFKILGVGGVGISFSACIYCLFTGDFFNVLINGTAGILAILLLHYVEKTGHYLTGYFIVEIGVFMILFAVLFFTGSGMDGSMPYFFSFGLIFTFLMFEGRLLAVMETLLSLFYLSVCIISIRFPRLVIASGSSLSMRSERIIGIFLPALSMGMIFLLYIREYRNQKKIAEEANHAKSIFLANMSHEIRTPINAVLGFNEIILHKSRDASVKEYAGYIEQAGNRLLKVINEILDFSRIESGKEELVYENFSLREMAAEMKSMMSIMAEKGSLEYVVDFDEMLNDIVVGDREKLVRILTNLLSNAFKYTQEGYVKAHIWLKEETAVGQKVCFAVEDTGIGIKTSEMKNLFHAYERADLMKNRKIEGTGLGLPITEQLLHMFGSSVQVDSTYGKGSTFSFELSLPKGNISESGNKDGGSSLSFIAPDTRILVVDDDDMNRKLMDSFLRLLQIEADFAESGESCLSLQKKKNYDLILMDYMMPEMDGAAAMERIRQEEEGTGRHTPIIVLTADIVDHIDRKLKDRGFDEYLSKPVDFKSLKKMLLRYIPEELVIWEQHEERLSITRRQYEHYEKFLKEKGILFGEGMKLVNGDFSQYLRIAGFFTENAASDMEKMQNAADEENLTALRLAFHSLKGKAGSIGAQELREKAADLETRCRSCDLEYVRCGLDLVFLLWKRCLEGLRILPKEAENAVREEENCLGDYSFADLKEELQRNLSLCEGKKARATAEQMKKREARSFCNRILDEIEELIDQMEFEKALEKAECELSILEKAKCE